MLMLPDSKYFQYISHMYHDKTLIPFQNYSEDPNYTYSDYDRVRFERILIDNANYIKDQRVLDLGCHSGFMGFVAHKLGATSVSGVNARSYPIEVGRYFFDQLGINNVQLHINDIENFDFLESACNQADTVILSTVLEHCRNPERILSIISKSSVKNLIIESTVINDDNILGKLYYDKQATDYDFNAFDNNQPYAIVSYPNRKFFETVLYFYNWKVTKYNLFNEANIEWFKTPNLSTLPQMRDYIVLSATKD